jgi:hypothetical protein
MYFMTKFARSFAKGAKIGYGKPYNRPLLQQVRRLTTKTFNYGKEPEDEPDIFLYAAMGIIALYGIERYRRK